MNQIDPETLKYYIALQPKFREVMGESFLCGDRWVALTSRGEVFYRMLGAGTSLPHYDTKDGHKIVRLPLPIDPVNPKRGLQGMCIGLVTLGKASFKYNWFVQTREEVDGVYKGFYSFRGDTPELALLKALAHQEGLEVEGGSGYDRS